MCMEPVFIPRGAAPAPPGGATSGRASALGPGVPRGAKSEDDGWLVCLGFDTEVRQAAGAEWWCLGTWVVQHQHCLRSHMCCSAGRRAGSAWAAMLHGGGAGRELRRATPCCAA